MTHQPIDKPSRGRVKAEVPQKICPTCNRPFAWRKKWARDWNSVRYCSERCRRGKTRLQGDVP
jgi:hypothetical protein